MAQLHARYGMCGSRDIGLLTPAKVKHSMWVRSMATTWGQPARSSSLKGWNLIAQGNALGTTDTICQRALKGRNRRSWARGNMVAPLQGLPPLSAPVTQGFALG